MAKEYTSKNKNTLKIFSMIGLYTPEIVAQYIDKVTIYPLLNNTNYNFEHFVFIKK